MPNTWDPFALDPDAGLQRLMAGNQRFLDGTAQTRGGFDAQKMSAPQKPFAIVVGCSDSRTPVEILFDQGFGDLFVIRIAGNIVAPSGVGSVEFAASQFGTRLVVVMGHTQCGAITASLSAIQSGAGPESRNLRSITDRIVPHIEAIARKGSGPETHRECVRVNVRNSVDHLRHGSAILEELVLKGRLRIVGSEYDLETGRVTFFDY
ncbi:MAG TPA: carbonic anhydrase [Kofleriaceae bacterium]|nr:carbonic anhydrase [Kofleriaceae bacterium]